MSDAATRKLNDTEAGENPDLRVSFVSDRRPLSPSARQRLLHVLIGKSILETLLVAGLAVGFYTIAFQPSFRGWLDLADAKRVEGWVVDASNPSARVEVQLYIDGRFAASSYADQPRSDLRASGLALDDSHGFRFEINIEDNAEHEARVYAVHASGEGVRRTLQQIGKPIRFRRSVTEQPGPQLY